MAIFPGWFPGLRIALELASATLGMLGTCLMSRRYAPQLLRSLLYAAAWPLLVLLGLGKRWRSFLAARANINWDVPDSAEDMAVGLNLLFWAFFLQLVAVFVN